MPINNMVLSFSHLSDYYQYKIMRGRWKSYLGNYHLRTGVPSLPLPVHSTPPVVSAPEAIVDEVSNDTNARSLGSDGADTSSSNGASAAHSPSPATSSQPDVEPDPATNDGTVHDNSLPAIVLERAQSLGGEQAFAGSPAYFHRPRNA